MHKIKSPAKIVIFIFISASLIGCIGYTLRTPNPCTGSGDKTTYEWCAIVLWAVFLPIP